MNVTMMQADQQPPPAPPIELEQKALTLAERASAITVVDQESYDKAYEVGQIIKALRDEAEAQERPVISLAFATHKAAVAKLKKIDDPLKAAAEAINNKLSAYAAEQKRLKAEEDARAEAEQRRLQMEQLFKWSN